MEVSECKDVEVRYVHMSGRIPGMCHGIGVEVVGVVEWHMCVFPGIVNVSKSMHSLTSDTCTGLAKCQACVALSASV